MKENRKLFYHFLNKIIHFYLWMWIFGIFVHGCAAADFDDQKLVYTDDPIKVFDFYPPVAEGHEEIYDRFLNGKLIVHPYSEEIKFELRIADLANPLEGTFDLSHCGDAGKYLTISTGYRKGKKSGNEDKIEIWVAPRFLIEKELETTAQHFKPIMSDWNQDVPVGLFWTWGGSDDINCYDYLTTWPMAKFSKHGMYHTWMHANRVKQSHGLVIFHLLGETHYIDCFMFHF